jgi:hypothetical protein
MNSEAFACDQKPSCWLLEAQQPDRQCKPRAAERAQQFTLWRFRTRKGFYKINGWVRKSFAAPVRRFPRFSCPLLESTTACSTAVLSPPFRNTNAARSGKGVTGQPARWSNGYAGAQRSGMQIYGTFFCCFWGAHVRHTHSCAAVTKGKPLQLWGHELPSELLPSEVDIEVTHNGLCHSVGASRLR